METCFSITEIVIQILNYSCTNGIIYKNIRLVCSQWHTAVGNRIDQYSNHLWTLIKKCPTFTWYWRQIAYHPSTYPDMILGKNMKLHPFIARDIHTNSGLNSKLIYNTLLQNPNIDINFIKNCLGIDKKICNNWDWSNIVFNPSFKWSWLAEFSLKKIRNWSWYDITIHPNIYPENFRDSDIRVDWGWISQNPNLKLEKVIHNPFFKWNWFHLSQNLNISLSDIVANPQLPWQWEQISMRKDITWKFVLQHPDKNWDFMALYFDAERMWEAYQNPIYLNVDYDRLPKFRFLCVDNNKQVIVNFDVLSSAKNLIWKIVTDNPSVEWNWRELSRHPNITFDIIKKNIQYPWHWDFVSLNPNLTWRNVVDNPQYAWDTESLSRNKFKKMK